MNWLKKETNKLLFIQGGSRWKFDEDGNVYTDSNFNENVWQRYRGYCDSLTVILRREKKVYSRTEAKERFNEFDQTKSKLVALPDIYYPVTNIFDLQMRAKVQQEIKQQVFNADKIIIRSLGNIYTNTALKYAKTYKKPYLVEVTGFQWEGLWYHSLRGKIVAPYREIHFRDMMKDVPYAVYVTEEALQKRYPCKGKTLGCSDVELSVLTPDILDMRLKKINLQNDKIIIGTAAFLDVGWKGQEYVIRALADLKEKGNTSFEYQMIGAGEGKRLLQIAEQLGVENQVKLIGALPHNQVFYWLDSIDIYVQPSFQEGLCRSLVEAMSRACPIVCSDVGGNYELASDECLFKKADYKGLSIILEKMLDKSYQLKEAQRCYRRALDFDKNKLDVKRNNFYKKFMGS